MGVVLGRWQPRELRVARVFSECAGLSVEQLEDLYQETVVALLPRRYVSEEHLRNALRRGLKHRALNLHRDERRRGEILAQSAPSLQLTAQAREDERGPEQAALTHQDRLIVSEFLSELTETEQRVFVLSAEGIGYRAVAPALEIAVNEARNACRACERKRERFQLLYDTGRLCGFRADTIEALLSGKATSEELAQRAFAHLESCAHCRTAHRTNATRLRRSFQDGAAALLPLHALINRFDSLARLGVRARAAQQRLPSAGYPLGQGGARERVVGLLVGGGVGAKAAATVATVAVIAGGTIGATHALQHPRAHHRTPTARRATRTPGVRSTPGRPRLSNAKRATSSSGPERTSGHARVGRSLQIAKPSGPTKREPGGFTYLGVPGDARLPARAALQAHTAGGHGKGGPFSP